MANDKVIAAPESPADAAAERGARAWRLPPWALPIGSLVAISLVLGTAYNMRVPVLEAPDETGHLGYIDALQRTGKLPEITPEAYEALGPPLYHAVGAGVLEVLGRSPPLITLPKYESAPPDAESSVFVHAPGENDLPYRGPILSIHILRGISTLFGAGAVVFVYLIATLLFPGRPLLAWGAGANTALLPQFAFIGGSVANDTMVAFFAAGSIYFILRVVMDASRPWMWVTLCGVSLGLGFLTEASMSVAALACAAALLLTRLSWRDRGYALAVLIAAPLVIASWFYFRHLILYGSIYPRDEISTLIPLPLNHEHYRGLAQALLFQSYFYLGGWMNVYVVPAMYQFLWVIGGMALAGTILMAVRNEFTILQRRGLMLLAALFAIAIFQVIWINTRISFSPQGRFLFVAQPAIALLLAVGLSAIFQRDTRRDHVATLLLPVILLGLNIGIHTLTLPLSY